MAKKEQHIEAFIKMRIEGKTFDEISKELNVSKQSLINWGKDEKVDETIRIARLAKYQTIIKTYELDRINKIQRFAGLSKRINEELSKRDLSEIPTDKLLKLSELNDRRLSKVVPAFNFKDDNSLFDFGESPSFYFNPED